MNLTALSFPLRRSQAPKKILSESWEDREEILRPDVNLFCWQRPCPLSTVEFLEQLVDRDPVPLRRHVDHHSLKETIAGCRGDWDSAGRGEAFWQDVENVTSDFLDFAKGKRGTLHLRLIDDDACTKFHTDGYALRLFCTYHGPGTEWLPENAVKRSALGGSNEEIVKDRTQIQQMDRYHVGILKGGLPAQKGTNGIVHRSPAISETGKKRIILRIDI